MLKLSVSLFSSLVPGPKSCRLSPEQKDPSCDRDALNFSRRNKMKEKQEKNEPDLARLKTRGSREKKRKSHSFHHDGFVPLSPPPTEKTGEYIFSPFRFLLSDSLLSLDISRFLGGLRGRTVCEQDPHQGDGEGVYV